MFLKNKNSRNHVFVDMLVASTYSTEISNVAVSGQKKTACNMTMSSRQVFQEMNNQWSAGQSGSQFGSVFAKTFVLHFCLSYDSIFAISWLQALCLPLNWLCKRCFWCTVTCMLAFQNSLYIMLWWENFEQFKILRCDFDVF